MKIYRFDKKSYYIHTDRPYWLTYESGFLRLNRAMTNLDDFLDYKRKNIKYPFTNLVYLTNS